MNKKIPRLNKGDLTGQSALNQRKYQRPVSVIVKFVLFVLLTAGVLGFGESVMAADIYVDNTLTTDCISNDYSITNRDCYGSDGDAYTTVQVAISAMNPGDHIYLRGGTYQEGHIDIPPSKNGDSWEEGHYNKLCSYPGEWAILDGNNSCADTGTVLGHINQGSAATHQINYWWFEKFEIKHGTNLNTEHSTDKAGGFWGMVGPFKFRYMYIHDNVVPSYAGANPGGIKGDSWRNSLIEYCYFNNNGVATGTDANAANVLIYADYNDATIAEDGFDIEGVHWPAYNNTIRYNYFVGSVVGFKMKNEQLLSGRNPGGGHGFDDTYDTYGNDIHHNIFEDTRGYAIGPSMDFSQVYNNIIYDCARGIWAYKSYRYGLYKIVTYNNSIINTTKEAIAYFKTQVSVWETDKFVGYNYNNIFDNCTDYNSWGVAHALNISYTDAGEDLSDYYITDNYFYRPDTNDLFRLNGVGYTASEFESQVLTHTPRNAYVIPSLTNRSPLF